MPYPSYYIDCGKIIHYMGWLQYDMRVFKIIDFLIENHYIEEDYYNRMKHPEYFEEDYRKYNYENLDYGRVSYLILRTFNTERINEGTVNDMVISGRLLKLIERLEKIKEPEVI